MIFSRLQYDSEGCRACRAQIKTELEDKFENAAETRPSLCNKRWKSLGDTKS